MKNIYIKVIFLLLTILIFQNAYPQYYEWGKRGGGTGYDYANDCCVDPDGCLYIIGTFENSITIGSTTLNSSGLSDIFVAKYDTNGNAVWAFRAGGTGSDSGISIAQDGYGNIGITGSFEGTANFSGTNLISYGKKDVFCAKYYSSGSLQWVYKSGGSLNDIGYGIAFDQNGNVYITGKFNYKGVFGTINFHDTLTSIGGSDIFIMKFDPFGVYLWSQRSGSVNDDAAYGIAADNNYNIITTGIYNGKFFVEKYNTLGVFQWNTVINNSNYGEGESICTDEYGNLYVSGLHMGLDYLFSISYSKLSTNGNIIWTKTSGGYSPFKTSGETRNTYIYQENNNNLAYVWLLRPYNGTSNIRRFPLLEYVCATGTSWAILDIWQWQPLVDSNKVVSIYINPSVSAVPVGPLENNNTYWWRIRTNLGTSETWMFSTRFSEDIGNKIIFSNDRVYLCGLFNGSTTNFPPFQLISPGDPTSFFAQINPTDGEYYWIQKINAIYGFSSGKSIVVSGNNFYQTGIMYSTVAIGPDVLTSAGNIDFYFSKFNFNKAISIIKPEHNDKIQKNSNNLIKWKKYYIGNLNLYYSANYGIDWAQIGTSSSDSMFIWGTNVTPSTTARIKAVDGSNTSIFDTTANFTVCNLNVIYPVGGENLIATKPYNITWEVAFVDNLKIEYTTNNGGNWITIVNSTPASIGSYLWTVPVTVSNQCKIRLTDADYPNIISQSPNQFSIIPLIDLSFPNGGEIFQIGTTQNIKWISKGSSVVNLTYSTNNGITWSSVINNWPTQDSGNYNWTVPHTPSVQCKVRVTDAVFAQAFDTSNTVFTIANPNITVNSPNGGESLFNGSIQPISWESYGVYKVKIELSTNGGITTIQPPIAITNSNVGINSINWIVNNVTGANCKIKVTDSSNVQLFDVSNMPFSIVASPITLVQPNGGEIINAGINYNIIWSLTGFDFVKLENTTDNCISWNLIADNVAASAGTYNWLVPYNSSPNCRIKISNSINPVQNKVSSTVFRITAAPLQPVLISPANGSVGIVSPVNFYWYKSFSATSYKFQLSTDSLFSNIIVNDSTLTDSIKTVNNLLPLTKYFWRINARNNDGVSEFSQVWSFKTLGSPYAVVLLEPQNNAINVPTSYNFKWNKPDEQTIKSGKNLFIEKERNEQNDFLTINKFWFEITTDTVLFTNLQRDTLLTDTIKAVSGLSNLTKYFWRVKAKNQVNWGNFSEWFNFTTVIAAPTIPLQVAPANNLSGISMPVNIVWRKSQLASSYHLQLSTDSLFNSMVLNDSTITDTSKTVNNLNALTKYYWRVRAANIGGSSAYSNVWNFKTMGLPTQVTLYSPPNNSINQPVTLDFIWRKSFDQTLILKTNNNGKTGIFTDNFLVNRYWFELVKDTITMLNLVRDTVLTDTVKHLSGLDLNSSYYWRVKARNEVGWGQFSLWWKLTTLSYYVRTVNVLSGWNMVSVPLLSPSMKVDSLFPGATSQAYEYNNGYVPVTNLVNSKGYWLEFSNSNNYNITGAVYSPQIINLIAGWNMIGPFENDVLVSGLITNPPGILNSYFYGYNNGYQIASTLQYGKGYWISTTQAGTLTIPQLNDSLCMLKPLTKTKDETDDIFGSSWTNITVTDKNGKMVTLYLSKGDVETSKYLLPPTPPEGIFDVRFESNYCVELLGTGSHKVKLSCADYPVKIKVKNLEDKTLIIKDNVTGLLLNKKITDNNEVYITEPINGFSIIEAVIPTKYELCQNYPNPFNATTILQYSLPAGNYVEIKIYDILGKEMKTLVNTIQEAGYYTINIDAGELATGLYFVRMKSGSFTDIKKIVLIK